MRLVTSCSIERRKMRRRGSRRGSRAVSCYLMDNISLFSLDLSVCLTMCAPSSRSSKLYRIELFDITEYYIHIHSYSMWY